jgi:hypothetical protein
VVRIAVAVNAAEENAVAPAAVGARGYRFGLPAVDLRQHRFHFWLAKLVFRIPPVERAKRLVDRII